MKTIALLEDGDVIEASDWCRPLQLISMSGGMSDFYSFTNQYSGAPENNVRWVSADQVVEHWVGHTVGELHRAFDAGIGGPGYRYEFVRGELPEHHTMLSTGQQVARDEVRDQVQDSTPLTFGVFSGKTPNELLNTSDGKAYLRWLSEKYPTRLSNTVRRKVAAIPY